MDIDLLDSSTQDPDFFFPRCYGFHARVLYYSSRRQRAITTSHSATSTMLHTTNAAMRGRYVGESYTTLPKLAGGD